MIIWGYRTAIKVLGIVTFVCGNCHTPAAQRILNRVTKFTLFFIPLFPISSKYLVTCTFCGVSSRIDKEAAHRYVEAGTNQQGPPGPMPPNQQPALQQHQQPAFAPQPGPVPPMNQPPMNQPPMNQPGWNGPQQNQPPNPQQPQWNPNPPAQPWNQPPNGGYPGR